MIYQNQLIDYIENHDNFIYPIERREEILYRLYHEKLEDLSVSRPKDELEWGITYKNHVIYVWFDALINYLTNDNFPNLTHWPAALHIIGKDICWFHAVIWPCLLFSLHLDCPKTILAHGFVNDCHGYKMSKSLNNVIDPQDLLCKYNQDVIRCYLAFNNIGFDLNVGESELIDFNDSYLYGKFSNLIYRCFSLVTKINDNKIPNVDAKELFDIPYLDNQINDYLQNYQIKDILVLLFNHIDQVNVYFTNEKPWRSNENSLIVLKTS